jgi:hypothetical protein
MALCLAAAVVQAEPASQGAGPRPAAVSEKRLDKPSRAAETQRKQLAAIALTFTDDGDSVLLPAFASRTTPLPTRFLRVGVEWSF